MSEQIIQLLVAERNRLERAIEALQGSSPKVVDVYDNLTMPDWVKPPSKVAPAPKKSKMSSAGRRAIREGVRKRWAAINAAKAAVIEPSVEEKEFKSRMSEAMKASWAKRKKAAAKKKTGKG